MTRRTFLTSATAAVAAQPPRERTVELPAEVVHDKIRGGFLGQLIGDLNGLQHEMKYIAEAGNVERYTPGLPDGAWTDDDTDVEWIYVLDLESGANLLLSPARISELWRAHINRRIWCSHLYLRQLMDLGVDAPLTGYADFNPWADFNLSGQFVSETWGLISPGMPRTAARIGAHYTHVSVDGEPIQSTQMIAAMIATAFLTDNMERVLDAGAAAVDPQSVMSRIVADVRRWHRGHLQNWRATRLAVKDTYSRYGGEDMRDRNGVWLNGASTIAALLYGGGDFVETLRHAFNFGWDADNNAAACGAILGVMKGHRWLTTQGWAIKDVYRNTSRDHVPEHETITSFGNRLIPLAERGIREQGGSKKTVDGRSVYRIRAESAGNIEPLRDADVRRTALRARLQPEIERMITAGAPPQEQARAAYMAICLDVADSLKNREPAAWQRAVSALRNYPNVLQVIFFESPIPAGDTIRAKCIAAGLETPARRIKLWT